MTGLVTPSIGDLLAERYSLSAHINDDSSGRQVWRGMDVLLNRPVTVVLRTPGGDAAAEMLTAAVAASRVNHPNIVGVYDAVDQGDCAYIVREWVEGQSLRDAITTAPLAPEIAIDIMQCVASAVAAVHDSGVAHGNVHPGTVLLSEDDRVVLSDPRAEASVTQVGDVRAIGATLYCALTGGWPRTVPGPASLPNAPCNKHDMPLPIHEQRNDVPARLDTLITNLLSTTEAPPTAAELAEELAHIGDGEGTGALALVAPPSKPGTEPIAKPLHPHVAKRRIAFGAIALVGLALAGILAATIMIPSDPANTGGEPTDGGGESDKGESGAPANPEVWAFEAGSVQLVDPDDGDSVAVNDLEHVVDGDGSSNWKTSMYFSPNFGNYKEGMGLLLDLGEEKQVASVQLQMADPGNAVGVYTGRSDMPGGGLPEDLEPLAEPQEAAPTDVTFNFADAGKHRYLLIWCTDPAERGPGEFIWEVGEIIVYVR